MLGKMLKFIVLAYVVAFCQTILSQFMAIGEIVPNFGTLIIVAIVLHRQYRFAIPAAFMIGILIDVLDPRLLGLGTAIRLVIAYALYELRFKMDMERTAAKIYLLLGAELVFQLLYQPFATGFSLEVVKSVFLHHSVPTIVYTTVVGLLLLIVADLEIKFLIKRRSRESADI